jgi:hypothetical protein
MELSIRGRAQARAEHRATNAYLEELLADAAPMSFRRTAAPARVVAAGPRPVVDAGLPSGDHCAQLYWHDAEIDAAIADFSEAALEADETLLVVATPAHRRALEATLAGRGHDLGTALYTILDAEKALDALLDGGAIDPDRFDRTVGGLVRDLVAEGRPVRIYCEMVALLWGYGDVVGAMRLEALWNELRADVPFTLLCGYALRSGDNRSWLDALCRLHGATAGPRG